MDIFLLVVVVLQFGYIIYSDLQNRAEREKLTLKIMSRDVTDYKTATEKVLEESKEDEEDPYATIEEAGVKAVLEAFEK